MGCADEFGGIKLPDLLVRNGDNEQVTLTLTPYLLACTWSNTRGLLLVYST